MSKSVTLYLLHAEIRYKHAGHYLGVTTRPLIERIEEHLVRGNPLVRLMAEALGITCAEDIIERMVVATWPGTRDEERRLKKHGGSAKICPVCRTAKGLGLYVPRPARQGKQSCISIEEELAHTFPEDS